MTAQDKKLDYGARLQINRSVQLVAIALLSLFTIVFLSLITAYYFDYKARQAAYAQLFSQRNFSTNPFNLMDANDMCETEAKIKLGPSLLRYHMDSLSTRYDESSQIYLIVLDADVGDVEMWGSAKIYCNVDPIAYKVKYYKEVYESNVSILSKTMNALSGLFK